MNRCFTYSNAFTTCFLTPWLLDQGHTALVPGGIAEGFMSDKHEEVALVSIRKGFVKYAIETGTNLVPIYHFGHTQVLEQYSSGQVPLTPLHSPCYMFRTTIC